MDNAPLDCARGTCAATEFPHVRHCLAIKRVTVTTNRVTATRTAFPGRTAARWRGNATRAENQEVDVRVASIAMRTTSARPASVMVISADSVPPMRIVEEESSVLDTRVTESADTRRVAEETGNATAERVRISPMTRTTRVKNNVAMGRDSGTRGRVDRSCAKINPMDTNDPTTNSAPTE